MGEIGGKKSVARDSKAYAIKLIVFKDGGHGHGNSVFALLWGGIVGEIQPQPWNAAEGAPLPQHVLPQFARRTALGVTARHDDNGNLTHTCFSAQLQRLLECGLAPPLQLLVRASV